MRKRTKLLLILVAIIAAYSLFTLGYNLSGNNAPATTTATTTQTAKKEEPPTRAELLKLVNAERAKHGVKPLVEDTKLDWSAQKKADDMAKYDYFGHESSKSPNEKGDSRQWLLASGVQCLDTSENLAWTRDRSLETAKAAFSWWMQSEPHREAMLNPKYQSTGFGIIHNAIVEHFCQTS